MLPVMSGSALVVAVAMQPVAASGHSSSIAKPAQIVLASSVARTHTGEVTLIWKIMSSPPS